MRLPQGRQNVLLLISLGVPEADQRNSTKASLVNQWVYLSYLKDHQLLKGSCNNEMPSPAWVATSQRRICILGLLLDYRNSSKRCLMFGPLRIDSVMRNFITFQSLINLPFPPKNKWLTPEETYTIWANYMSSNQAFNKIQFLDEILKLPLIQQKYNNAMSINNYD